MLVRWHDWAANRALLLNLVVVAIAVWSCVVLFRLGGVETDWLALFDRNDPVSNGYIEAGLREANWSMIYVRLPPDALGQRESLMREIARQPSVATVVPRDRWLFVALEETEGISEALWELLSDAGLADQLTGIEPIVSRYADLVAADLVRSTLVATVLVAIVVLLFVDSTGTVFLGFWYEGVGLLVALAVFHLIIGPLNIIASAVPGILIGLGVDFVIHVLMALERPANSGGDSAQPGARVYRCIGRPMFWGATTTALGFASLTLMGPRGVSVVGILGGLGVFSMFAFVFLFYPPTLTALESHRRAPVRPRSLVRRWQSQRLSILLKRPTARLSRAVRWGALGIAVLVSSFLGRLEWEALLPVRYYPQMREIRLMFGLSEELGVYPSFLHLSVQSPNARDMARVLQADDDLLRLIPGQARINPASGEGPPRLTARFYPVKDPFVPDNLEELRQRLRDLTSEEATVTISGDAVLIQYLLDLLTRSMAGAYVMMTLGLGLVLTILFRSGRFVLSPVAILVLASVTTLGALALTGAPMSIYNLTVLPLLMGIGIDDGIYLADSITTGRYRDDRRALLTAISLTTVTTVAGYSSLLFTANRGLRDMGQTAVLGLLVFFACTVVLLPWFLGDREVR